MEVKFLEEIKRRIVSKKFQAWGVATWLLYAGKVSEDVWLIMSLAFLGADVVQTLGTLKINGRGGEK